VSCRLLGVSRSGYYEWNNRPPSARDEDNELLLKQIQQIHADSRGSYELLTRSAESMLISVTA
jgi:putative transposase